MATQNKTVSAQQHQTHDLTEGDGNWQTKAALANAARLEQALTDQATKTHETLSDMLIFADSKHGPVDIDPHLLYYPPDGHRGHDSFN
jgi:hypothetical protein